MARVVLENVTRIFPGPAGQTVCAVNRASLAVEDKELLVLVGPSGCGKTTLLRLIAGLEELTGGAISLDGRVVNNVPPKDRDIAMVFQHHALYPHMTAFENMAFGLTLRRVPRGEVERRVRETADMLGLTDCINRRPKELSGGQRQRVALGRALVRRPKVLLLDEPLSNLDGPLRAQMRAEIARLHRQLEATMIYVTHDQVEAMTLGDRIAVMKDGVIQQTDAPLKLYERPANLFVAGFIGSPPMNCFEGEVVRKDGARVFRAPAQPTGFSLLLDDESTDRLDGWDGRGVVLGIRPGDISPVAGGASPNSGGPIEAVVEFVEPLGAETHLQVAACGRRFVVRVPVAGGMGPGQKVSLVFNLKRAHFFDVATGRAVK